MIGFYADDDIPYNKNEVADYKWLTINDLKTDLQQHPEKYTPWLGQALDLSLRALKRPKFRTKAKGLNIELYLKKCQKRVNTILQQLLPFAKKQPIELHQAMRYAVLNGGKRIRAALVYATGEALDVNSKVLDRISAAVEIIHAYTLIHDDLPAIDNDDLRRGKPSCHKAFSESTAILAGDALQTLAFQVLSKNDNTISPEAKLRMIAYISNAIGSTGVIGGEALDIAMENKSISLRELTYCYKLKTSYLISSCVILAALAADYHNIMRLKYLEKFSYLLGVAFQIHDDIIGMESDTKTLGKQQGGDALRKKPTYPSILTMVGAKKSEAVALNKAIFYLKQSDVPMEKLLAISNYIIQRHK
jgi:farnesyl diphosphate synthase